MSARQWIATVVIGTGLSTNYASGLSPQNNTIDSNAQCVSRLRVPSYPYGPRTANSEDQTAQVVLQLGADSTMKSVQIEVLPKAPRGNDFFKSAVEAALKASEFSKTCGGQSVRLTFRFKMGTADAVWFEYPGTYEIIAAPLPLNRKSVNK